MSREDDADDAVDAPARATSWLDGLGTRLRETASVVTEKLDAMDDQLDSFARRALGDDDEEGADRALSDGDAFAGAREGEFTNDEIDALRQALSIAKQELNARDEQLREARDDAGKMRETAIKAAKELAKEQRKRKAAEADGAGGTTTGESAMVEVEKLKADLEDAETATRRALEDAAKMEKELRDAEAATATARAEIDDAKSAAVKEVEALRAELASVMEKLQTAEREANEKSESSSPQQNAGSRGGRGKKGKKGGRGGGASDATPVASAAHAEELEKIRKDLESVKVERDNLRAEAEASRASAEKAAKEHVEVLERVRAEAASAKDSATGEEAAKLQQAESRAATLEDQLAAATTTEKELRNELAKMNDRAKASESEIASLRDELTDAIAAREDAEGAVSRGAVNAANANAKMAAAEKAKTKAEAELAELRKQVQLMDATGREAATSIAAREKAELAQQRAETKLALAEKEVEEARAQSEKAAREGEERKRRFAHVQSQFQVTEKELREKLETFESELKVLRANADEAEKMKEDAVSIVEETQADAAETKEALTAVTAKAERLERALETAEAAASEARTKLGVLEEMESLRKTQPVPEPSRPVSKKSASTQTDATRKEPVAPPVARDDGNARKRLIGIMERLDIPTSASSPARAKEEGAGIGMLMGMFMGSDERDENADDAAATPRDDLDSLFDRVETWASDDRRASPASAPSSNVARDTASAEEVERLRAELAALKADVGERSAASLAAVNRRAQEAERAAADAKAKLAPLEKANRELAWQISLLAEQDETKTRPVLAQSGWFARAVTGCTAPRRPPPRSSVLLQNDLSRS